MSTQVGSSDIHVPLERQSEIRAFLQAHHEAGQAPCAGLRIQSREELDWLFHERNWSGQDTLPAGASRPDLRGVVLSGVDLSRAPLRGANLSHAILNQARLQGANLQEASMRGAVLDGAHLADADMRLVDLTGAYLYGAALQNSDLERAVLNGADLYHANLTDAYLFRADLTEGYFFEADLSEANLGRAMLCNAVLTGATMKHTALVGANLSGALAKRACLQGALLRRTNLSGADLRDADLRGASLVAAHLDAETRLGSVLLSSKTQVADVNWSDAILTQVDWTQAPTLGDESIARGEKNRLTRANAFRAVARAYHGLTVALRAQGVTYAASQYRLREQQMERRALRAERKFLPYLGSGILDLVSGYGERPSRIFIAYLAVLVGFAGIYEAITRWVDTTLRALSWDEALVLSVTSFHGRGFFPGTIALGDWVARVGAVEAIIGLFIELIFIATFSRRFLGG